MTAFLLSVHVLGAIVLIGPSTVAASLFPRYAREALRDPAAAAGPTAVARALHRICRGYAVAGLVVPVFGLATAQAMGALGQPWLLVSIVLTAAAALVLALGIIPAQRRITTVLGGGAGTPPDPRRLSVTTGVFALTWTVVVVLMILRPGSTTGV